MERATKTKPTEEGDRVTIPISDLEDAPNDKRYDKRYDVKRTTGLGKLVVDFRSRFGRRPKTTSYERNKVELGDTAQALEIDKTACFDPSLDRKTPWLVDAPEDGRPLWAPLDIFSLDMHSTDSIGKALCIMRFVSRASSARALAHGRRWNVLYMGKRIMARVEKSTSKLWIRIDRYCADKDLTDIDVVAKDYANVRCISLWITPAELIDIYPAMQYPFEHGTEFFNSNALTKVTLDGHPDVQDDDCENGTEDDDSPEHKISVTMQPTTWLLEEEECKRACIAAGATL